MSALLAACERYQDRPWAVVPVSGKRPVCPWSGPLDPAEVRDRIASDTAVTGIAVILGERSGDLVVRDFDRADGYESWREQYPRLAAELPTAQTARGYHVYARWAPSIKTIPRGDGEIRGAGAILVLPPSRTVSPPSGAPREYTWIIRLPGRDPLPEVDPAVWGVTPEELVRDRPRPLDHQPWVPCATTPYGAAALDAECRQVATATVGHRHTTLRDASIRIASLARSGVLDWASAVESLTHAARSTGLPHGEIRALIDGAWRKSYPRPLVVITPTKGGGVREHTKSLTRGGDYLERKVTPARETETRQDAISRIKASLPKICIPIPLRGTAMEPVVRAMLAIRPATAPAGEAWYADVRMIAEMAGRSPSTTHNRLRDLHRLGWLSLIEPGIPGTGPTGKANRWRWHDPPQPGATTWHGATMSHRHGAAHPSEAETPTPSAPDWRDQDPSPF